MLLLNTTFPLLVTLRGTPPAHLELPPHRAQDAELLCI